MPVLMILGAIGFMLGTGGIVLVALTYGEGKKEQKNSYFYPFVYAAFGIDSALALLGFIFIQPVAALLSADYELLEHCIVYARIILAALPFFMLQVMLQSICAAADKPQLGLIIAVSSDLINMNLDAMLVPLLPKKFKMACAAITTAAAWRMPLINEAVTY